MKVKDFLTYLQKCDPEDEVFMIQYDRGDTMDIAGDSHCNQKDYAL